MHGIGNDYVYVDAFRHRIDDPAKLARDISDRHFGVGSDGLILLLPPDDPARAHLRMRMFNADGSESEMCGNGIRCACKLAYDYQVTPDIRSHDPIRIQTGAGILELRYTLDAAGRIAEVTVDMGRPQLDPARIPVAAPGLDRIVDHPWQDLLGRDWTQANPETAEAVKQAGLANGVTAVSMGNPHLILYVDNVAAIPLAQVGPLLEHHPAFPRRINIHFVQVHDDAQVTMRTWERGSGITLACGTGASAVCVAGVLTGRTNRQILAHLPGGDLKLQWPQPEAGVLMTGPAVEVFTGEYPARP